jgi:uncharacterized protein (TIGR01777 family)
MTILITGATGLIGTSLVEALLKQNHTLHYLTTQQNKVNQLPNCSGFFWNPNEGIIDEKCFVGVDVIVHLAGASIAKRWTPGYKKEVLDSRIKTTHLLFNTLQTLPHQVKKIVSASGTAIYPDSLTAVYNENATQVEDSFLSNVVQKWEEAVQKFHLLNIKSAQIRTGVVYSAKGGALLEIIKPIKMGFGSAFGSGQQIQSWIHLTDLVQLYCLVINSEIEGVVNAVAPQTVTNQELTEAVATHLNRKIWLPNVPQWVMKLVLGDMSILLFNSKKIVPQKAIDHHFQFQYPTLNQALNEIIK